MSWDALPDDVQRLILRQRTGLMADELLRREQSRPCMMEVCIHNVFWAFAHTSDPDPFVSFVDAVFDFNRMWVHYYA
tara:strand:- start:336 stop:566 length:231 start_codon:yes stop_codon:yes gene_type:complete